MTNSDLEFTGTLFPVFVTTEATLDEINQLIRRSDEFILAAGMSSQIDLYVISSASESRPTSRQPWPLPPSFESTFLGASPASLAKVFKSSVSGWQRKGDSAVEEASISEFNFGIIDEQSIEDGTVLCSSVLESDNVKPDSVRADVEIAAMTMYGAEMNGSGVSHGVKPEEDGIKYERLTEENRAHYLGQSDDEDDDDDAAGEEED